MKIFCLENKKSPFIVKGDSDFRLGAFALYFNPIMSFRGSVATEESERKAVVHKSALSGYRKV